MNKDEGINDAMITDIINKGVEEAVKLVVTKLAMEIILEVVRDTVKSDPSMSALKDLVKHDVTDCLNTKIEVLVNERVNKTIKEAQIKAALHAELEMAKKVSATRAAVIKILGDHLELRTRQLEDFTSVLEQTCFDNGEDGLGAGGPHTDNLNIAHEIGDKGDEILKKAIEQLQTDLPGEVEISEIEADIAKITAEEVVNKEEVVKEEVVRDGH